MRFEGIIKSWNEERAFGFIEPSQGGQEIFVHISALPRRQLRPAIHQRVTFEIELNRDGKKRARNVRFATAGRGARARPAHAAAAWGGATLFVAPAFALLYLLLTLLWRVPHLVAGAYFALSVLCFVVYAADKSAAQAGGWRTQESTLLLLGLLGGWPGAILAQQLLRHKSSKASFRSAFWSTVVLNVGAFVALSSPWGGAWHWLR